MRRVAAISARGAIRQPGGQAGLQLLRFFRFVSMGGWYKHDATGKRSLAVSSPAPRGRSARVTRVGLPMPTPSVARLREMVDERWACDDAGTSPEAGTADQRPDWTLSEGHEQLAVSEG